MDTRVLNRWASAGLTAFEPGTSWTAASLAANHRTWVALLNAEMTFCPRVLT